MQICLLKKSWKVFYKKLFHVVQNYVRGYIEKDIFRIFLKEVGHNII